MTSWPALFTSRAASTPEATALIDAETGDSTSYPELDEAVDRLAGQIAALGVEPGDRVGLLAGTSLRSVRGIHAVLRLGAMLVPLNVRQATAELDRQADVADLDALLCTAETAAPARSIVDAPVASVDGGDVQSLEAVGTAPLPTPTPAPDDHVVALFTSGTTGEPKAVPLTARNLVASACASAFRLGVLPDDRWLLCLPIYHMGGLAPVLRSALYGITLVVRAGFDAAGVARATRTHDATGISLVPTQLRRIVEADASLADSLRFVLVGGAPTPPKLVRACADRDIPIHPTYGMTETASQVTTATPAEAFEHEGTVGRPLLGTDVLIRDKDGTECSPGEVGEIVVSGPTVTPGYLGNHPNAFGPDGFHTGDRGYRDEAGRLWVTGRVEDTIVTGGENVAVDTVEAHIRDHPDVTDVAVVGLPDPEWGERVVALVASDADLDSETIEAYCRDGLADFERPKTVVVKDSLPRTASGTVDRQAVRDRLLASDRGSGDSPADQD